MPLLQGLGCRWVRKSLRTLGIQRAGKGISTRSKPQAGEKKSLTCCSTAVTVSTYPLRTAKVSRRNWLPWSFVDEKEREMEPVNGSTYLMMGHTHPHPSFPVPLASRIVLTTELLRSILIPSWDVEKIFSGLDFKTWPEGSRRVLQKRPAECTHRARCRPAQSPALLSACGSHAPNRYDNCKITQTHQHHLIA